MEMNKLCITWGHMAKCHRCNIEKDNEEVKCSYCSKYYYGPTSLLEKIDGMAL